MATQEQKDQVIKTANVFGDIAKLLGVSKRVAKDVLSEEDFKKYSEMGEMITITLAEMSATLMSNTLSDKEMIMFMLEHIEQEKA